MEDWTARARRGDADALAELWRIHHHLVSRYLRGRGIRAHEDVASQVWVDVARSIDRFEGTDDDFPRWLFTIARRRYVDYVRATSRRPEDPSHVLEGDDPGQAEPSAEDRYDADAALDRAIALVRRLPDTMGEVVLLRVVADLSVSEVAEITGKTEGHVRVLAHRGLQRLRELLEAGSTGAGQARARGQIPPGDRVESVTNRASTPMEGLS